MPSVKPSTVLGRQLGDALSRFRENAGLATADAAGVLDCTKGKISRIENGHVPVRMPDLTALTEAYGVRDTATRERLATLARRANRRRREGWWYQYGSLLGDAYRDQIEMEAIRDSIRAYQVQLVPGLLQTPEYGSAATGGIARPHPARCRGALVMSRDARTSPALTQAIWQTSSHSGGQGDCVEIAVNIPGAVPVRDSKRPHGPVIGFSPCAWRAFLDHLR